LCGVDAGSNQLLEDSSHPHGPFAPKAADW
jgi:hypothetical protein